MNALSNSSVKQLQILVSLPSLILLITLLGGHVGGADITDNVNANGSFLNPEQIIEDLENPQLVTDSNLTDIEESLDNVQNPEDADEVSGLQLEINGMLNRLDTHEIKIDMMLERIEEQINQSIRLGNEYRNFVEEKLLHVNEFQRSMQYKVELLQLGKSYSSEVMKVNLTEGHPLKDLNVTNTEEVTPLVKKLNGCRNHLDILENELKDSDLRIQNWATENRRLTQDKSELKTQVDEFQKSVAWLNHLNVATTTFNSALFVAAYEKDYGAVQLLVELGADLNVKGDWGESPLHTVGVGFNKSGCLKIIKYLIEKGANVYARENTGNLTFLHNLVADGTTLTPTQFHDIVEYLTSKKLEKLFSIPGWAIGVTPLAAAVKNMEVEPRTLKLLQEHGVDFGMIDRKGESLLSYALAGRRNMELLDEIIAVGVDPHRINIHNQTLIHVTALALNVEGIAYLLKLNLDINATDSYGNTPLHHLIVYGKGRILEMVRVLIENGADIKIKNGAGRTPLEEAELGETLFDRDEVVELLKMHELDTGILE